MNKGLILVPGLDNYLATHTLNVEKAPYVAFIVTEKSVDLLSQILEKIEYTPETTKKFFVKDINSLSETTQEFFNAFYWLRENFKVQDIAVDATNILPSMAFPVYFAASFIEVFKELIEEDVRMRLLFTNVDWKVVKEGELQAYGEPIFGSARTLELEHPMTGIGFILGAIASDLFNQGSYLRAEKIFNLTQDHTLGDEHLLYAEFVQLTKAYDHWDKFDFKEALEILQSVQARKNITGFSLIHTLKPFVEKNITALLKLQKEDKFEQVVDIFENAERRMAQGKYDDAVARYYRCLDMIAQYALSKHGVNATEVNLSSLPKEALERYQKAKGGALPERYQEGVGGIALRDAYLLLACLEDSLGKTFEEQSSKFIGLITARNYSILGHGTKPITKERAEQIRDNMVLSFLIKLAQQEHFDLQGTRESHRFPQLPTSIKSLFSGTHT